MFRHSFSNRETKKEIFLEMQKEYYDRLDCRYDGESMVCDPETLFDLANTFSFEKKQASAKRREAAQARTDYGTTRRVDADGQARARKDAQNHFGVDNANGRKIKGRRQTRPPAGAWADAPSAMNFSADVAGDEAASAAEQDVECSQEKSAQPKKRGRRAGTTNKKVQPDVDGGEKRMGAVSQAGMFKKWVLFRYSDDIYVQKKHEREAPPFPILCGQVTAIAERETSLGKLQLNRCTGDAGELKEPWALCIERYDLEVQATGDPKRPFQLRRKPYGCHPAVSQHEKMHHHSTYHMSFDLRKRLVDKWGSKSAGKWPRSYTYLDFKNPNHKFVLLHEDAQFTGTQHLQQSVVKELYRRNDKLIVQELNKTTAEFKGVSRPPKKKAKVDENESTSPAAFPSSKPNRIPRGERSDSDESEAENQGPLPRTAAEFEGEDDLSEGILSDSEQQMFKDGVPIEDFCRARKLPNEDFYREALAREFEAVQHQQITVYQPGSASASSSSSSSSCSSSSVVNDYRNKTKSTKKIVVSDEE